MREALAAAFRARLSSIKNRMDMCLDACQWPRDVTARADPKFEIRVPSHLAGGDFG